MSQKVHVFEKAGLGKAPFTFIGMYVDRGPKNMGNGYTVGSPGQPMGTCDYCGTGIANCCRIQSSDGKVFVVGTDCVEKTGDSGLRAQVDKEKIKARHASDDQKIEAGKTWAEENRPILETLPYGRHNLYESLQWYFKNAGRSGKLRVLRDARKAVEKQKSV